MYVASTFISNYATTSKTLRIKNSSGQIVFSLNVCNYQKSSVVGNNLKIVLEDNTKEYNLDFSTSQEAKQALLLLKLAIDTLTPNCTTTIIVDGGTPTTVIPVTYLQYKTLQGANNLLAFQWYDVTDATGLVLTAGDTMRLRPLTTNDIHPEGLTLNSAKAKISINILTDQVLYYEEPIKNIILINSKVKDQTIDNTSSNLIIKSNSKINCSNSQYVELENNSSLIGSSNTYLKLYNGCNVIVNNSDNCVFENIQQNFIGLSYNLSHAYITQTDSIGKLGREQVPIASSTNLFAYFDLVEEEVTLNTNNNTMSVVLHNDILQANAVFYVRYVGTGTNNKILIKDTNANVLFTLTDINKLNWAVFTYNKTSALFEFTKIENGNGSAPTNEVVYTTTAIIDGQTLFPLPIRPNIVINLQMFINGQKRRFGSDFTYDDTTIVVIYLNTDFTINIGDEIDFIIY